MTLDELFRAAYAFADAHGALLLLALGIGYPVVGTIGAWIGKGGQTDSDGRLIASTVIGGAILAVVVEIASIAIGQSLYDGSVLHADVALLAAPLVCLVLCLIGIRSVFPLNELASIRTLADVGALLVACGAAVWFFAKFRGWGIVFLGSLGQLVVVALLCGLFLRRLYRRAFGLRPR
jgi:hypothetical protein